MMPIILLSGIMEVLLREIPNRYNLQHDYLLHHGSEVETLLLGSSHVQYGINPEYLSDPSFNLGNVSQTLEIDYALLKAYEQHLPNLKTVVLRLSYATLFEQLTKGPENWRIKDYELYMKLNLSDDFRYQSEVLSLPFRQNIKRLYEYYIKAVDPSDFDGLGWGTATSGSQPKPLETIGRSTAKKHTISDDTYIKSNEKLLKELISWCQTKEIRVVLISLPVYKSYYTNLNDSQLYKTLSFGKLMTQEFENCSYINMLDDGRFIKDDFFDADHLNAKGAKKFSSILNSLLTQ